MIDKLDRETTAATYAFIKRAADPDEFFLFRDRYERLLKESFWNSQPESAPSWSEWNTMRHWVPSSMRWTRAGAAVLAVAPYLYLFMGIYVPNKRSGHGMDVMILGIDWEFVADFLDTDYSKVLRFWEF